MFGKRKMYKKGLETAMQAYADFGKKQQEALEHIRNEVRNGNKKLEDALSSLGEDIFGLYDYLNSNEKAALYKLGTPEIDIKELEEQEKRLLLAVLYQLADDSIDTLTENQKSFIRSVQKYLNITNPQTTADYEAIENIDSLDVQKVFLQVSLEFMYLQDSDEYTELQETFLECFSVNRRQASQIEFEVSRMFNLVGAQGIAEKYGYVPEPEEGEEAETVSKPNASVPEEDKSHYEGIPEEIIKKYDYNYSDFSGTQNYIETKDYFVFKNDDEEFIKYNKITKEETVIDLQKVFEIDEDDGSYSDEDFQFDGDDLGVNYNGNTFAIIISHQMLYFYDLNNDNSYKVMEYIDKQIGWNSKIYLSDNHIVLVGHRHNTQIACFDLNNQTVWQLKCGIGELTEIFSKDEVTMVGEYILFRTSYSNECLDKNGTSLKDKICIGDLNSKEIYATDILEKIKTETKSVGKYVHISINSITSCRNMLYIISGIKCSEAMFSDDSYNYYIHKIKINGIDDFEVTRCAMIHDDPRDIHSNYNYIAFENDYSIYVFNTETEKLEQVAEDCCHYSTSGKLIKKQELTTSEFKLVGQWILHDSYDDIYITDINKPMECEEL